MENVEEHEIYLEYCWGYGVTHFNIREQYKDPKHLFLDFRLISNGLHLKTEVVLK